MSGDDVVVTGLGVVSPLGIGARDTFRQWVAGTSGVVDGRAYCRDFDPAEHFSRKEIRRSDRFAQMAILAGAEAVREAQLDTSEAVDPDRVACVVGTSMGGSTTFEEHLDLARREGIDAIPALGIPMTMGNAATVALSIRHGLRGPCYSVNAACATGGEAIAHGLRLIRSGAADAAVVGGTEGPATDAGYRSMTKLGIVSEVGVPRPFDRDRDGLVHGEGAGILVLERRSHAEARGAIPLAVFLGECSTADAFHVSAPEPSGASASRAIGNALRSAGVEPEEVSYVNAHGTATVLNDRSETAAIKTAFGEHAERLLVSSLKSAIGHTIAAAGAIEGAMTVLSLRERTAPPTLNLEEPEPGLDLDFVPKVARELPAREDGAPLVAVSNSFGFGGHNSVLVFREEPAR